MRYVWNRHRQMTLNRDFSEQSFHRAHLGDAGGREGAQIVLDAGKILRQIWISDRDDHRLWRRMLQDLLEQDTGRVGGRYATDAGSGSGNRDCVDRSDNSFGFAGCLQYFR